MDLEGSIKAQLDNGEVLGDLLYKGVRPTSRSLLQDFATDSLAPRFSAVQSSNRSLCQGLARRRAATVLYQVFGPHDRDEAVVNTGLAAWNESRLEALSDTNKLHSLTPEPVGAVVAVKFPGLSETSCEIFWVKQC